MCQHQLRSSCSVSNNLQSSNEFFLQSACRKAIRKRLLDIDFHAQLYNRIDELGMPSCIRSYLLFNIHPEIEDACKSSK